MERADAVVVGGGPAGSTCARELVRAGLDVLVLDRARFPRDKPCAGWITPPVVEALDLDLGSYARDHTLQAISGFRVGVIGGGARDVAYPAAVSYGIRRCELDAHLLERCGARLSLGQPVRRLEHAAGRWRVDGRIETPLLIGAGGHFCPVARLLNPGPDPTSVVVAREIELPLAADPVRPERPELYFCRDLRGYGWLFRKGDYLNVGLGRLDRVGLHAHLDGFLEWLRHLGHLPTELPPRWKGHAYRVRERSARSLIGPGVLLAGDAAGLAHPESGEGIRTAVESGLLAARTVLECGGDYRPDRLAQYPQLLERHFGPARRARPAPGPLAAALGRALLGAPWFTRHVVVDRWFLHRQETPEPALAS